MIKLINDWELDSDGTGYVVRLNSGKFMLKPSILVQ